MKPILHTIKTGGSPRGLHQLLHWLRCPEQARLRLERENLVGAQMPYFDVGILYHAFQKLYHTEKLLRDNLSCIELVDENKILLTPSEEARIEAERLFRSYRGRYTRNRFGRVLDCEVTLGETPEESRCIEQAPWNVPHYPVTGRIDMVVSIGKKQADSLNNEAQGIQPGLWLVDWKTDSGRHRKQAERYTESLQGICYTTLWNTLYPKKPAKGILYAVVYKNATIGHELLVSTHRPDVDPFILGNVLSLATRAMQQLPPTKNPTSCIDNGFLCPFMLNPCERY